MQGTGTPGPVTVLRLLPGEDLRRSLEAWAEQEQVAAACIIAAVGSLSKACLRPAGRDEPLVLEQDLELCGLSGTLSRHGLHLHLMVADDKGRSTGGHLLPGCLVRTTMEIVVQSIGQLEFLREHDDRTGYRELFVKGTP